MLNLLLQFTNDNILARMSVIGDKSGKNIGGLQVYTVGQVAEFLGISRDTLKFYEKKDLIKPMKDDENGYRRYSDYDVCDVMTTNFYRQLDIEIKKI